MNSVFNLVTIPGRIPSAGVHLCSFGTCPTRIARLCPQCSASASVTSAAGEVLWLRVGHQPWYQYCLAIYLTNTVFLVNMGIENLK